MANEFGYTLQNLPKIIVEISQKQPEPIQFGPNEGGFPVGFVESHRDAKREFLRLARRALRLQSQAYLDIVASKLAGLEVAIYYIPAG